MNLLMYDGIVSHHWSCNHSSFEIFTSALYLFFLPQVSPLEHGFILYLSCNHQPYLQLFSVTKQNSKRTLFCRPIHSITAHFAEWYRLIPLQSLNAENHERYFKGVKTSAKTTNYSHGHQMVNSLVRHQVLLSTCSLHSWEQ